MLRKRETWSLRDIGLGLGIVNSITRAFVATLTEKAWRIFQSDEQSSHVNSQRKNILEKPVNCFKERNMTAYLRSLVS